MTDVDGWRLALVLAVDVLLGALVLWHVWGPLRPPRWRVVVFTVGVLITVPGLAVAVVLFTAGA